MTTDEWYEQNHPLQLPIRRASGGVSDSRLIVALLYRLMRDEITPGKLEGMVLDIIQAHEGDESIDFTNGWLAKYAKNIAYRLGVPDEEV